MKKQIILNVDDSGYYIAKLIICSLYNRKRKDRVDRDTIEVIINCSDIIEKRLDIPNLKYSNEQIKNDSKLFINFPFKNNILITGEGVFNVMKGRTYNGIMEDLCEYLEIEVDLSTNTLIRQYLLTLEYLDDILIKIEGDNLTIDGLDFFMDTDLINLINLSTEPTLKLADNIKNNLCPKQDVMKDIINNFKFEDRDYSWDQLGDRIIVFPEVKLEDDIELNRKLYKKMSGSTYTEDIITTAHILNLLSIQVISGDSLTVKLPKRLNDKFKI